MGRNLIYIEGGINAETGKTPILIPVWSRDPFEYDIDHARLAELSITSKRFFAEVNVAAEVAEELGLLPESYEAGSWTRQEM